MSKIQTKTKNDLFKEIWGIDIDNKQERRFLALHSYRAFCLIYFPHYFYLEPATFHNQLMDIFEDDSSRRVAVIGFRGSAKSTHGSMAYPIWEIVRAKHKFIILLSDSGQQVGINVRNIRDEFQDNDLLANDFPIKKPEDFRRTKWSETSLEFENDVFLLGLSRGQKIRGMRYRQHRPTLVIGDDLESLEWVRHKGNRDKSERWLRSEVIPAMDEADSKLILIGNLLHNNALMTRIQKYPDIEVLNFPLIKEGEGTAWERCTWKAKYPTPESLKQQRETVGEVAWNREYLLKIISEDEQIIKEDEITYYSNEVLFDLKVAKAGVGQDFAITEKEGADYTAMVSGYLVKENDVNVLYISPNVINKRIGFRETLQESLKLQRTMPKGTMFYPESTGYQKAAIQELKRIGIPVSSMTPVTDKRARLESVSHYVRDGLVRFPESGAEELIQQVVGFGVEEHDDLVDALTYLIYGIFNQKMVRGVVGRPDAL